MRYIILCFLFLLTTSGFTQSGQVKECFSNYKKAILDGKGADAFKQVDQKTRDYYDTMIEMILTGDSLKISQQNVLDKLTILVARARVPNEKLMTMTGKEFFIYAVDNGMIGKGSVMLLEIDDVKIDGNSATAQVVVGKQLTPMRFSFNKESDGWKGDLTSIFESSMMALKNVISENGMTDTEFIYQMLETLTGKKPAHTIWAPIK